VDSGKFVCIYRSSCKIFPTQPGGEVPSAYYSDETVGGVRMIAFNGRWSEAMRVRGVRTRITLTSAPAGDTHMRSRANIGKQEGNVRMRAVFPSWVWIQRNDR